MLQHLNVYIIACCYILGAIRLALIVNCNRYLTMQCTDQCNYMYIEWLANVFINSIWLQGIQYFLDIFQWIRRSFSDLLLITVLSVEVICYNVSLD